jgi:HEAT repeat protein
MNRRLAWGLVVLLPAAAVLLVPGTRVYLPDLLGWGGYADGHSTRYWNNALTNPSAGVRCRAVHALGVIGPEAGAAVPALADILLHDPQRACRIEAAMALRKMRPASRTAVPALARALEDDEPYVRMNAALALLVLRGHSRPAVGALTRALEDARNTNRVGAFTHTVQEIAAMALGRAGAGSAEPVGPLTEALKAARTEPMRLAAIWALGEVGAPARPASPLLHALLQGGSGEEARTAEEALQKIEGKGATAS